MKIDGTELPPGLPFWQMRAFVGLIILSFSTAGFTESSGQPGSGEELSPGALALRDASPGSDLARLASEIDSRLAAGEVSPDAWDLNLQLVNCQGLADAELDREGYLALGFNRADIACENTRGGRGLLEYRRWECATRPSRSCICGKKQHDGFFYFLDLPQYQGASFGPAWKHFEVELDGSSSSLFFRFDRSVTYDECSYAAEDRTSVP